MKQRFLLPLIIFAGLLLAACGGSSASNSRSNLRVVHASPDAGGVDVLLDNKKILTNFQFKDAIAFNSVEVGTRSIKLNATGTATTALTVSQDLKEGRFYTVIATNALSAIESLVIEEDGVAPTKGKVKLRVTHAAAKAGAVDVYVTGPTDDISPASFAATLSNVTYKMISAVSEIAPADYRIQLTSAGSKNVIFDSGKLSFAADADLSFVAMDQNQGLSPVTLVSLTRNYLLPRSEAADVKAQIRFVHVSPDAPALDGLVDDVVFAPGQTYSTDTAYLPLVAGTRAIKLNNAGVALVTVSAAIGNAGAYSVYAVDQLAKITPLVVTDNLALPTAGNASIRFVNVSPDGGAIDIFQDDKTTAIIANQPFKGASIYLSIPAGSHAFKWNKNGTATSLTQTTVTLEAGKIYSALLIGNAAANAANPLAIKLITDR